MKTNNAQVLVIGDANADMVIHLPVATDKYATAPPHPAPKLLGGGTAANVVTALARLGLSASFVGTVGADNYGRWLRDDLINEGVDVSGLKMVEGDFTVLVMAVIETSGERLIYVWPPKGGAHLQLGIKDVYINNYPETRWLHTTGICLRGEPARETILNTMAAARNLGWKVSIDLNLRIESWGLEEDVRQTFKQAIELSNVVFGNADEEILPISGKNNLKEALQSLCDNKRIVVARTGEQGAMVCTPDRLFHSPAFPVEVVDTLGAGDAFNAGFIAAQLDGSDVTDSARWGNALAAYKIEHQGARGLPNMEELQYRLNLQ